jgi:TolA-binding protein
MSRRITLLFVFLLFCATSAWPKWNADELKQLDERLAPLIDQLSAMQNQMQTLNKELQELKQNQAQLQVVIMRQQRGLQEINQMVSTMSLGDEEHYSKLKTLLDKYSSDTQVGLKSLGAGPAPTAPQPAPAAERTQPKAAAPVTTGYIVTAEANNYVVGLGSKDGMQAGIRLALYKGTDLSTRVGVLEVTQVIDTDNCRVKIIVTNSGAKPEFGDVVRLEQQ